MRRRRAIPVVLLAAALLLAGCANIPTRGDVSRLTVDGGAGNASLVSLPDGPITGASQKEILDGFIKAGRGPQLNYQVAREFLTDDFAAKWNPNAGVLISSSPIDSVPLDTGRQITIAVSAEVGSNGRYTEYAQPQSKPLQFTFAKNKAGQWRVASAPDGTVLTPNRFSSIFHSYPLYFFDPSYQYLVPDQRWFADTRSIPALIVKGLLAGPSDWLSGGVLLSAFPTGTELTAGSPTIDTGRATVDLSSQVSGESATSQRRMLQQLNQSFSSLGTIRSAAISVGGFPLTVTDGPQAAVRQDVLPDPVGYDKGLFGTLVDGTVHPLTGLSAAVAKLAPSGAALARNGTDVAVLGAAGVSVIRGSAAAVSLDRRPGLAVPSSDPEGFVWSVPTSAPGAIIAYDTQGKPHSVAFSYDGTVVSMDVSRDGTRVLIALATGAGPKLVIAGVIRDKDLVPTGLGPPIYPAIGSGALLDAAWVDNNSIVVLAQRGSSTALDSFDIGGMKQSLGSVDNGVAVVGGNTSADIRVLDSSGTVFGPSGSFGWQDTGQHASFLAVRQ